MFFLKQLGSLLNAVKEIDPDANPSVMIKFKTPNGSEAKAVYVHNSFDGEGDSQGSIVLYNGDDKTEFDSLQYTVDGIQGLCNSQGAQPAVTESVDSSEGSMYTIENSEDEDGENDFIIELPASKGWTLDDAETFADILRDSAPNSADVFYMGSYAEGGTFFQIYVDQKEVRPMSSDEWTPTIKEAIDEIYGDNDESGDIERSVGSSIDTAMMDHYDMMNGDIGDIFESSVKTLCGKAGKPALAEAVIKLFNVYKPVMEAVETNHRVIPEEIAKAVNAAQAEDYGWRPETAEREFEETWDWLEDHADTVLDAWNANNDPREVVRAIENEEERGVWAAEASMMEAVEDIPTDVKQKIADFANMYGIQFTEIDDDVRNTYYREHESKNPPNADYGLDIGVFDDNWKLTPKGQRAIQYMKAMGFSHEVDYNKYGEPYLLFTFDAKKDPFLSAK